MKILFLSKRRPQGRDLLTRPYGRFFHIPRILSERGHDVCLLLLSYKKEARSRELHSGMTWITESVFPSGPLAYLRCAKKIVEEFKPDWVVGFSDTYYGILAVMLGERYGIGSVIDAYDNYESYIPWLKPLHRLWRKALAQGHLGHGSRSSSRAIPGFFQSGQNRSYHPHGLRPDLQAIRQGRMQAETRPTPR